MITSIVKLTIKHENYYESYFVQINKDRKLFANIKIVN